ncbi:MAG: ATP-binding protein [Deltaproteobacteria bacterium]|nr:ATP-binding protein [Deltaproteobacteria bacterium]
MNLRERLLFLLIPLTISPLVFITVVAYSLFGRVVNPGVLQSYASMALVFIGLVSLSIIAILVSVANSIAKPLNQLTQNTRRIANGDLNAHIDISLGGTMEVDQLASAIDQMQKNLKQYEIAMQEEAVYREMGRITAHVAHDLASPLSSMQVALEYFRHMKEIDKTTPEHVNLLELSSKRLKSISRDLLDQYKGSDPKNILFSIHKMLDELVGEYQAQPSFARVDFIKQYSDHAIFLHGERDKLQRVFGNLIKNAIEAMNKYGTLTLKTQATESGVIIEIQDTGSGMSQETLEKILKGGVSHGKKDGHGIGIAVVQKSIAEHGGKLECESELGSGTTFRIKLALPGSRQNKNVQFEEGVTETFALVRKTDEPVVIIDDDASMLEQWRLILEKNHVPVILSSSYEDFVNQRITPKISSIAIVDYHFENSELNGLQVIRKLKEQGFQNLYLCTAEYWKPSIQKEAKELGVTICPKPLPKIVIASEAKQSRANIGIASSPLAPSNDKAGYTVLVIDDDAVIRMGWGLMKEKLHIATLHCFASLEEMQSQSVDLTSIDIAFVDKNIDGSAFNGATVLNYLKSNGVSKIVLASGEREEDLKADPQFALADFVVNAKIPRSFKEFFS